MLLDVPPPRLGTALGSSFRTVAVELVERVVEVDVPVVVTETVQVVVPPRGSAWVDALRDLARQIESAWSTTVTYRRWSSSSTRPLPH